MTILEKISSVGRVTGTAAGALLGGLLPYRMMKKELSNSTDEQERNDIKKKYLSRILLSTGAGSLAGGLTGSLISHRNNEHPKMDMGSVKNYLMPTAVGTFLGSLPGAYDFHKAQTEEEKENAKKKLLTGAGIGGSFGLTYKTIKRVDKGLK